MPPEQSRHTTKTRESLLIEVNFSYLGTKVQFNSKRVKVFAEKLKTASYYAEFLLGVPYRLCYATLLDFCVQTRVEYALDG